MRLAEEGCRLLIADINESLGQEVEQTILSTGGSVEFIQCDVSDIHQVEAMINRTVELYSALHILVNNAGTRHLRKDT